MTAGERSPIVDRVRRACAQVAAHATCVSIELDRIPAYAGALPRPDGGGVAPPRSEVERERTAAHWLTLDAINFGSGWFPTLRKPAGRSGYSTIAGGLERRFEHHGAWSATELSAIGPAELADVFGQDPDHELMQRFSTSLKDLGTRLERGYGGSFLGPVEAAGGSAVTLVETLAAWPCFADTSTYGELEVPLLKRAQIAAADLHRAGAAHFADLHRLTMFADNLVPHVLRLDQVLAFDPVLVDRIERGELIVHGSPEEVEIRACALHAVELIVAAAPVAVTAAAVDQVLWQRGHEPRYKAVPRHRARTTAY